MRERGVRFGSLWFALLLLLIHMSSEPGERMTLHILRREGGDAKVAKMQNCKIAKKCRIAEFIGTHALLCAPLGWAIASQVPEITNAF